MGLLVIGTEWLAEGLLISDVCGNAPKIHLESTNIGLVLGPLLAVVVVVVAVVINAVVAVVGTVLVAAAAA